LIADKKKISYNKQYQYIYENQQKFIIKKNILNFN